MEADVWSDARVKELLSDEFVVVELYVDFREKLPESEQYTTPEGKSIRTVGQKWTDYQIRRFGSNSQPYYVITDPDDRVIAPTRAYDTDVEAYLPGSTRPSKLSANRNKPEMDPRPQPDTQLFLPTSRKEMERLGWDCLDVILVSGDAYVDHPSFAAAVIGRVIQAEGFRVGIIPQPDWRGDAHELCRLGRPRLFFGVSGGNMDPMVNHYTAARRRRSDDAFTPGGKSGARPDYATSVYTQTLKRLYPDVPVVIGGIEASMRRLAHYDYWQDKLLPSILTQSGADLLVYGMGEKPFRDILSLLGRGVPFTSLKTIPQTAFLWQSDAPLPKNKHWEDLELPSYETCREDKRAFAQASRIIEVQSNRLHAARLTQRTGEQTVVVNPPYPPMSTAELDAVYELPFTRLPHPRYAGKGEIPAYRMIRHSITIHRGCFGGCAFCTISAHQGKFVTPVRKPRCCAKWNG